MYINIVRGLGASAALTVGLLLSSTPAFAVLESRLNGQAVYDTDFNITWLADANLAATNTFGVWWINADGSMSQNDAQYWWIPGMNAANYLGFNDWRLPSTQLPDSACSSQYSQGYGCTGSEMGHLFYTELGGTAGIPLAASHNASYALFSNVQMGPYVSSTQAYPGTPGNWGFDMSTGAQWPYDSQARSFVWAVRSGDVAAVPEPGAWAMMLAGLTLVSAAMQRRTMR